MTLPTVITTQGLQPQSPASLLAQLLALVSATVPGYTANLPGSLIEDVSSTQVAGLSLLDSARVDAVNSLTPFGANAFLLNQLGQIYGVQQGLGSNTSVYVVFAGTVGFIIPIGFTVSDGAHQYVVQDGGIVGSGGTSDPVFCVASSSGSWSVPANTVTTLITSVPGSIMLSVNNPTAGTPGASAQTEGDYRTQVLQAGLAAAQSMPRFLKTLLANVSGVQARLISVRPAATSGLWEVIVGGGDPYQVANAIFRGVFDVTSLTGSTLLATAITRANPGVVTTNLNHGYATGQAVVVSGSNPAEYDGSFTATVIDEKSFSIGVDTTAFAPYVGSAVVSPNLRNVTVSVVDYPDTYPITFVNPPQQTVTMAVTWNTTSTNVVPPLSVAQLAAGALAAYVNSISVGQPINVFELQATFQAAVADIIPTYLITTLDFVVSINGIVTAPTAGTGIIEGDPESYFTTDSTQIFVAQG